MKGMAARLEAGSANVKASADSCIVTQITDLSSDGYSFETDVLIYMIKNKFEISTVNITTVYLNGNTASHFKPISDSIKIYRSILAFSSISFFCFIIVCSSV